MKLINETYFNDLVTKNQIKQFGCEFLDSFKIGINIEAIIYQSPEYIDLTQKLTFDGWQKIDLANTKLVANNFYIAISKEKICLPPNIFGQLSTRSTFSRVGLDVLLGSNYVSPGFGNIKPIPLVLELSPKISLKIPLHIPMAGLLLFEIDNNNIKAGLDHSTRFPFNFVEK